MRSIYKEYGKSRTFGDKSKGGLFSSFLKEYRDYFGVSVTPGCNKCLTKYWSDYENIFIMNKQTVECAFRLKAKYNGIQQGANGQPIRNGEMTDEVALKLLEWHPLHKELFDIVPDIEIIAEINEDDNIKESDEMTLAELRERYPEIKARSVGDFLEKLEKEN